MKATELYEKLIEDKVKVKVERASLEQKTIDFSLVLPEEKPAKKSEAKKKPLQKKNCRSKK